MTRRILLLVAAVLAVLLPATAGAQDRRPSQVVTVDATNDEAVTLVVRSDAPPEQLADAKIAVEGEQARVTAPAASVPAAQQRLVILIEASAALEEAGGLVTSREAAKAVVEASDGLEIAIYSSSDRVRKMSPFTADKAVLLEAIDRVTARSGNTLWDSIAGAARVLGQEDVPGSTVIVVTGTPDDGSNGGVGTARGALTSADARLNVVGLATASFSSSQLQGLAADTGGSYRQTDKPTELDAALEDAALDATNLYTISYAAPATELDTVVGTLAVGGETLGYEYGVGQITSGKASLEPTPPAGGSPLGFLSGTLGLMLGIVLVLAAVTGIVYSLAVIFTRDNELSDALSMYTEGYLPEDEEGEGTRIKSAIVQRAVDLTEQVAEQQGFLGKTEVALEQAKIPLRAAEALFFYLLIVLVLMVLGFVLIGGVIGLLFMAVLGVLVPPAVVSFKAGQRKKQFMAALPDMLQLLAGTLRAGFSLMQGVEAVSQEVDGPMGDELRRVVTEARLGRSLEDALNGTAERMQSQDFAWAVMAIGIQREVGGNLAELLITVADTMIQRERLRGEISALTAEGRVSAIVLGIMPPGLGVTMYTINPTYMETLFTHTLGNILLGLATVATLVGFVWMKKIIDIDI